MITLAILGSGSGSNAQAIHEAISNGFLEASIQIVASDKEDSYILERFAKLGIQTHLIDCESHQNRFPLELQSELANFLLSQDVDLVCLAGFMRLVKKPLLEAFPNRILNIHPSLLPAFPGLEAWTQAIDAGAKESGCTVHVVDSGMDTGPIIAQRKVPVLQDDTPASLHQRIQVEEHTLYPEAIASHAKALGLL